MRRTATALVLSLAAALTTVVATTQPANADAYDTVTRTDPKNDLVTGRNFPDIVKVTAKHVGVGRDAVLVVVLDFRKDRRWHELIYTGFVANNFQVAYGRDRRPRRSINLHNLKDGRSITCKVCRIAPDRAHRRVTIRVPWSRLGSPSNVLIRKTWADEGFGRDETGRLPRVLY